MQWADFRGAQRRQAGPHRGRQHRSGAGNGSSGQAIHLPQWAVSYPDEVQRDRRPPAPMRFSRIGSLLPR
ncbi:hypothetical protein HMPREF1550_00465 [Actinomyces sp. oral taxon 877 str. F0543]|nr:hypothetical protein HMPREF1550_00465 [Actinomyces sp. oral taxon 877 str. F0543]